MRRDLLLVIIVVVAIELYQKFKLISKIHEWFYRDTYTDTLGSTVGRDSEAAMLQFTLITWGFLAQNPMIG